MRHRRADQLSADITEMPHSRLFQDFPDPENHELCNPCVDYSLLIIIYTFIPY